MSNSISVTQLITEAHDHQKGKVCSRPKCKQHNPQPLSEFSKKRDKGKPTLPIPIIETIFFTALII